MKKLLMSLFIIMMILLKPALAEEFENVDQMLAYWGKTVDADSEYPQYRYPDYVCGFKKEGDTFIIELTDEKYKDEVLALVADKDNISFAVGKYSFNELNMIRNEIIQGLNNNELSLEITGMGVGNEENKLQVFVLEKSMEEAKILLEKYGDRISLIPTESYDENTISKVYDKKSEKRTSNRVFPVCLVIIGLGLMILFIFARRESRNLINADGTIVKGKKRLSDREIIQMIKNTGMNPGAHVLERVKENFQN